MGETFSLWTFPARDPEQVRPSRLPHASRCQAVWQLSYEEIRQAPDRCAFKLVRFVYEAFGFPDEAVSPEYDRKAGRLALPEG